jgi:hypothetical protein
LERDLLEFPSWGRGVEDFLSWYPSYQVIGKNLKITKAITK